MRAGLLKVSYSNLSVLWAGTRDPKRRKQGVDGEAKARRSSSWARALFSSLRFSHCHLGCLSHRHPEEGLGGPSPKEEPANTAPTPISQGRIGNLEQLPLHPKRLGSEVHSKAHHWSCRTPFYGRG